MNYKLRNNYSTDSALALREILTDRGVKDLENFLNPSPSCELDPYGLDNIDLAATKLLEHLRANSNILIVIDPDVDGVTSSSILWLYIKHIFPNAKLSFTLHEHKQHGIDDKIDWILNKEQFNLVVVPDAGSFNIIEHQRLYEAGIDCICIDHHELPLDNDGKPLYPNIDHAIVVNNQLSDYYKNKSLCGAGVVYKFCEVLDDILGINQAQEYLDLVALGEIADVMDRRDPETNYLMLEGLKHINNKGFQTLVQSQSFSLKDKAYYPYDGLTTIDIAFYIAPLINSIIRVGTMNEKECLFYCFIEPDRLMQSTKRGAKQGETETAAEQTARVGKNAKARQDKAKEKAIDLIDFKIQKDELNQNNVIIVEIEPQDNIPQEIGGLVAMAVVNKYNKPCLMVRRNENNLLQGSARSNGNFASLPNFKDFLEKSNYFEYVAGHDNAFGQGIQADKLQKFIDYANKTLSPEDFKNCYIVDYILNADNNNYDLLYSLSAHPELFGNQIDEIKIIVKNISLANIMAMGPNKDSMKISYNGIDYVKFKDIDFVNKIMANRQKKLDIYARINLNFFNGKYSVQCFIDDYEFQKESNKYDF